jgi:hypothetical protein
VTAVYAETFEQLQRLNLKAEVTRATKTRDYETIQFLFLVCLAALKISGTTQHRNTVDMIYLLTAIGLSPGGSTHLHTNNTQNNTNNN